MAMLTYARRIAAIGLLLIGAAVAQSLDEITQASGVTGGLVVQIGCGNGDLLGALAANPRFLIQGLEPDAQAVRQAQTKLLTANLYGRVTVDRWQGPRLPYANESVNLVITGPVAAPLRAEIDRVLAPNGVCLERTAEGWSKTAKAWPADIDEWTHYLHDPGNNAVAEDTRIAPPRSLQWMGSPKWARHHDRLASMSALVTTAGRVFCILDEGSTSSILLPSSWQLIARDAFNGVVLWKQPIPEWQTRMWPLKSGPAQLPRRLVAVGDTVYVTLGIDVPVTALDAATGAVRRVYDQTKGTEELLVADGTLYVVADAAVDREKYLDARRVGQPWWHSKPVRVMAVNAATGDPLWEHTSPVIPLTLAVQDGAVFFHNGQGIVSLDSRTGAKRWESVPVPVVQKIFSFFAPTLVARPGVVLFAGGEESGLVKSTGGATKSDTLTGLDAATGKVLWTAPHPPSGYSSPEDVFVIGDTVWFEGVSNGGLPGVVTGLDLRTGAVRKSYEKADVDTYWFHHRCYRGKATSRFLMTSRTGIEFIDPATGHWDINHWTRGGCLYGVMPANGLIYTPPHACACFPEAKLFGFTALSAGSTAAGAPSGSRLEQGPAFGKVSVPTEPAPWPTYRGNAQRSGSTTESIPGKLAEAWQQRLGGKLSALTVADGLVFVSQIDQHTIHAIAADTGQPRWQRTVGGRVDSPPTIFQGMAIFGCADGWIYSLRASDGELAWRFRAAPEDTRILAFEQLESRWPVPGSVLVQDGIVSATAGRSMFLDGGIHFVRLAAATGELLGEEVFDERNPATGENLQADTQRLTLPVALPDVLSSDGTHLYMRSQVMDLTGKRQMADLKQTGKLGEFAADQAGENQHLFASAGFLDEEWFHRAYWVYGRNFEGGWNAYYLAGKHIPAGKILSFDQDHVYGFGRQPQFYRWTTAMEFQLFASPRGFEAMQALPAKPEQGAIIRVAKSPTLSPANQPVSVSVWIRPLGPDGVLIANGGGVLGYTLYVAKGVPHFGVAIASKRFDVAGTAKLSKDWHHLVGILAADGTMKLHVDGTEVATGKASGLLPKEPANAIQIGADEESLVGPYSATESAFKGDLDEVRIYRGELPAEAIVALAQGQTEVKTPGAQLVLYYAFEDDGKATDASGKNNDGDLIGANAVEGRLGDAVRFTGVLPGAQAATKVPYLWSVASPILVRAMVSGPGKLVIAGPPDVLNEEQALTKQDDETTLAAIVAQNEASAGRGGGLLQVVSAEDGKTLQSVDLPTIPVWDGLAAGSGRLFLAGTDGTIRCYAPAD